MSPNGVARPGVAGSVEPSSGHPEVCRRKVSAVSGNGGWGLLAALAVAGGSNLLFHLAMSRSLSAADYGGLGALSALLAVALVPTAATQLAVTRAVTGRRTLSWDLRPLVRLMFILALSLVVISVLVGPWIRQYLHLRSAWSVALVALVLVPTASLIVSRGVAMGRLRFGGVAGATLAGAFVKLGGGWALVQIGLGIDGALLAVLAGETATAAIVWKLTVGESNGASPPLRIRVGETVSAIIANSGLWLLAGMGVILARHHRPEDAGYYAAAWLIAGLAYFLPAAVANIAFPRFAQGTHAEAAGVLTRALLATASLGAVPAAVMILFGPAITMLTVGGEYSGAQDVLPILAVTSLLVAVVNTLVHFHLARGSARAHLPWFGVAATLFLSLGNHGSIESIAWVSAIGTATVLVLLARPGSDPSPRMPRRLILDEGSAAQAAQASRDVSIVVPYFNPGPVVEETLRELAAVLDGCGVDYELIPVADGCTDESDQAVAAMGDERIRPIALAENAGKGEALSVGLARARGRYIGFMDADGEIDPSLWEAFITLIRTLEPDIVLGSKRHPMSEVEYPPLRRVYSFCYQIMVRLLFRLKVRDTQTGIKLMRREVLHAVLPHTLERRFTFDLELLVVARRFGFDGFFEAPVRIRHKFRSTISLRSVLTMLIDTLVVFHRLHVGRIYEASRLAEEPVATTVPLPVPISGG